LVGVPPAPALLEPATPPVALAATPPVLGAALAPPTPDAGDAALPPVLAALPPVPPVMTGSGWPESGFFSSLQAPNQSAAAPIVSELRATNASRIPLQERARAMGCT
jgi:hypothetical protein